MQFTYKHTRYACYMAYITGAIINNLAPLLFVIFQNDYNVSLIQLSYVIGANFGIQLVVDFLCSRYANKIGHRRILLIALFMSFLGLISLAALPELMYPFAGIMISVLFYAIGSGLLEVMVSPTIEALPGDKKTSDMSILHSFYCWGCVIVIIVSTLFFEIVGVKNWRILCYLWALVPFFTMLFFLKVPIIPFGVEHGKVSYREIFSNGMFRIFVVVMICSGASEIAIAQWTSWFAETGLGVSKAMGDLLGPCMFALAMGVGRISLGKYGEKFDTFNILSIAGVICVIGYLVTVFSKNPILSLFGCTIVGFGSAIMWPATLSIAAKHCSNLGVALFGLLAMGGDIGCCIGPMLVAKTSTFFTISNSPMKAGFLCALIFPVVLMISVNVLKRKSMQK